MWRDSKLSAFAVTNCIGGQLGRQTERLKEWVAQWLTVQEVATADDVPISDDEPHAIRLEEEGAGGGNDPPILTAYQ